MKSNQELAEEYELNVWKNNSIHKLDEKSVVIAAFLAGIEADRWMPCKKELPKEDGSYLVNCTYCGIVVRVFNTYHNCWDGEDGDDHYTEAAGGKITHWQPLPA